MQPPSLFAAAPKARLILPNPPRVAWRVLAYVFLITARLRGVGRTPCRFSQPPKEGEGQLLFSSGGVLVTMLGILTITGKAGAELLCSAFVARGVSAFFPQPALGWRASRSVAEHTDGHSFLCLLTFQSQEHSLFGSVRSQHTQRFLSGYTGIFLPVLRGDLECIWGAWGGAEQQQLKRYRLD